MTFIILTIFIDLFFLTTIHFSSLQVLLHRILIDEKFHILIETMSFVLVLRQEN